MAVALNVSHETDVDEAVEMIWTAVLAGTYKNPGEAARALWHTFEFSANDLAFLGLFGLIRKAQDDQRHTRRGSDEEGHRRPSIGYGAPHGKKQWAKYLALTWAYQAADGGNLPLLEFAAADLEALASRSRVLAESYESRADWAESAQALLAEHGVGRVRELPRDVLETLNASCEEVFST